VHFYVTVILSDLRFRIVSLERRISLSLPIPGFQSRFSRDGDRSVWKTSVPVMCGGRSWPAGGRFCPSELVACLGGTVFLSLSCSRGRECCKYPIWEEKRRAPGGQAAAFLFIDDVYGAGFLGVLGFRQIRRGPDGPPRKLFVLTAPAPAPWLILRSSGEGSQIGDDRSPVHPQSRRGKQKKKKRKAQLAALFTE